MLASVDPRSRPVGFQLLKIDGPNGEFVPGMLAKGLLWGIDPARSRESNVEELDVFSVGSRPGEGALNGLRAGVGFVDLGARAGTPNKPEPTPPGENLDGTVPARARRVVEGMLSGVGS